MSRISSKFASRKVLIGYLTVGYPDIGTTVRAAKTLEKAGCDIIELGIPFSDPIGDGPVIQAASHHALQNGITPAACIEIASQLRREINIPLVFMGYYNPILNYGIQRFCRDCQDAGVNGLIIPDLPPEESGDLAEAAVPCSLDLIYLLAPTSTADRISVVTEKSEGFIYLTSVAGITGARDTVPDYLPEFIARVRTQAKQPIAVGFGISSPDQAKAIANCADGVIIGSKLLQLVERDPLLDQLNEFISSVRKALDG
ncbi:tryptophan synthase subunit alpha [Dehalogenimonas etheniformans]|uniref:Tryptophan synthase alpha chain n=1 Tax=Dehalogenimonas etheniformans TaxID=1536648 RepID=A0A2P5P841_9CHLR|nr:tryptophan synthase subunit alpha [Dehalogenimonas etheniformans]PPD58454.1 tryptophan synthase subunit alpha [Dehalogenimonas etheniformans]QNT75862.1 tryptophan synthase subunit alpha [Dehalogenimonas etheniformans]